jgi:hypothetical protein
VVTKPQRGRLLAEKSAKIDDVSKTSLAVSGAGSHALNDEKISKLPAEKGSKKAQRHQQRLAKRIEGCYHPQDATEFEFNGKKFDVFSRRKYR